jgi:integrase
LYNDGFGLNLQVRRFWSVEYLKDSKVRGKSFEKEELALAYESDLKSRGIKAQIKPYVTKSWLFRFMLNDKDRKMGLGSVETTSLAKARELAQEKRDLLRQGIDPIAHAEEERAAKKVEAAKAMTFKQCAEAYIEVHKPSWTNAKHAAQWPSTLSAYAYPIFGDSPVQSIDVALVIKALEPIWHSKAETAARLRSRIENVLDWATARKFRQGDNPARWRGHLNKLLPARSKLSRGHHSAVHYAKMPAFMGDLRARHGLSARALEFTILTAARTNEALGARWSEIDLESKVWTVPAERTKAKREHRVPLSKRALAVLAALPRRGEDEFVFMGARDGRPLSSRSMLEVMRSKGATVHGFRSTFRDWAAEQTSYPNEMCEIALAHAVSDKTEAAYRRGDMMEKRWRLMADWGDYCEGAPADGDNVIPIRERA